MLTTVLEVPPALALREGEYVAILEPPGRQTFGSLMPLRDRPGTGLVFRAFHLVPHRTATENVVLGLRYHGMPRSVRTERAVQALAAVGLGHRTQVLPRALSSGERRRVTVARALVNQPDLLLCEDPTADLDRAAADSVLNVFDRLHGDGLTLLVVTRDDRLAARAHRIVRPGDSAERASVSRHTAPG
jgi:putative ABC transport system ATP-binding protein